MKLIRITLTMAMMLSGLGSAYAADSTHADPAKKAVGDGPDDLAPLATGKPSEPAPLEHANFPPPGGAVMSGSPDPAQTGSGKADKQ